MTELAPPPDDAPSLDRVILPSRAFLLSWREQTLPARAALLEDAVAHFERVREGAEADLRQIAALAAVAEAMQALEDLAYLGYAWDRPFAELATYVRATAYSPHVPTNFWQEVPRFDDARLDVFAGFAGRDPSTQQPIDVLQGLELIGQITPAQDSALRQARLATRRRLRQLLAVLARDWKQYSPYFHAFKHGGLALNRADYAFATDDVEELRDDTPRHEPSIAVWDRRSGEPKADFALSPDGVVRQAAGIGRLAADLAAAFVESRLTLFDAMAFSKGGELVGVRALQLPWTIWLKEADLPTETWQLIGRGPRITWASEA